MKTVATLPSENIDELKGSLEKEGIACECRSTTGEGDLEISELLVGDSDYDRACQMIEGWQEARAARGTWRCPKCGSKDWEWVEDAYYQKVGLDVYRCKKCGCERPVV